ncbi:hypothetical protein ACFTAO_12130 [Paenibacillus rhizoplanae]
MITVGREIIHRYDDAKPTDMDEFLNSMVKISAHPIHMYHPSGEHSFYGLPDSPAVTITPRRCPASVAGKGLSFLHGR